jgi:hypothetical protein
VDDTERVDRADPVIDSSGGALGGEDRARWPFEGFRGARPRAGGSWELCSESTPDKPGQLAISGTTRELSSNGVAFFAALRYNIAIQLLVRATPRDPVIATMSPTYTIAAVSNLDPVDSAATCHDCGHLGTAAVVVWSPKAGREPQRFCRRCWPDAHRRHLKETRAMKENPELRHFGSVVGWHWSLAIGTLFREMRDS